MAFDYFENVICICRSIFDIRAKYRYMEGKHIARIGRSEAVPVLVWVSHSESVLESVSESALGLAVGLA